MWRHACAACGAEINAPRGREKDSHFMKATRKHGCCASRFRIVGVHCHVCEKVIGNDGGTLSSRQASRLSADRSGDVEALRLYPRMHAPEPCNFNVKQSGQLFLLSQ